MTGVVGAALDVDDASDASGPGWVEAGWGPTDPTGVGVPR